MKKIFKNPIFMFILGAIMFAGVGVYAGAKLNANEISYIDRDNNEITVDRALTTLYNQADGIFESLGGMANPDKNESKFIYTSTFDGKILAVMSHYTPGTDSTLTVDGSPIEIKYNYVSPASNGIYTRNIEYATFNVVVGQEVICSTSNITGGSTTWGLSACSLYRIG